MTGVRDPRRSRFKSVVGLGVSVVVAGFAAWVLWRTFQRISFADVLAHMIAVPLPTLVLASCCVAGAFAALAAYEVAVVRYVRPGSARSRPAITALIAFPLGHALGQTMLSGGALRYRMYTPIGLSATEVGATALLANLPYGLAVGLLLDLALVLEADTLEPMFRISSDWLFALGCVGLAKDAGYALVIVLRKAPIRLGGWAVPLPTPALTALQLIVGIVDVTLVSTVLYLLLPETAGLGYLGFLAVYLASVIVGVLSHVPAGLGVLESMLLLLLPDVPPEQLLAAVLTYRAIYEVVPMLLALALWGVYEAFARDGARSRLLARVQLRGTRADRPTIDRIE